MNAPRLQTMVLILAAGMAGFAQAGTGDITKRDQGGGSVELSNLGSDEDAAVVVAAPARAAVEAVARPMPTQVSRPAPEVAAADRQARPDSEPKRKKSEEENADERTGDFADAASSGREGYANYGGGFGSYGYGNGAGGTSTGVIDTGSGGSGGSNGATSGNGSNSGGTSVASGGSQSGSTGGNSSGSGYGNSNTVGAGSAPTAGLSPDQLALRVAQYRDAMLNEQRGANGLVANPAVQRRYLMINRAGYMGLGY